MESNLLDHSVMLLVMMRKGLVHVAIIIVGLITIMLVGGIFLWTDLKDLLQAPMSSPSVNPQQTESDNNRLNGGDTIKCDDIPQDVVKTSSDNNIIVKGPEWSGYCRYVAWSVSGSKEDGIFVYHNSGKLKRKLPIPETFVSPTFERYYPLSNSRDDKLVFSAILFDDPQSERKDFTYSVDHDYIIIFATSEKESVWKTYTNKKFNYSFQYPSNVTLIISILTDRKRSLTFEHDPSRIGDEVISLGDGVSLSTLHLEIADANLTLKQYVETRGSFINLCNEDKPEKTEEIITKNGTRGLKAWYWIPEGCAGARTRFLNNPSIFFDARPKKTFFIEFYDDKNDDGSLDKIASTFKLLD